MQIKTFARFHKKLLVYYLKQCYYNWEERHKSSCKYQWSREDCWSSENKGLLGLRGQTVRTPENDRRQNHVFKFQRKSHMRIQSQISNVCFAQRFISAFKDGTGRLAWMWRKKASWTITARTANMHSAATTANLFHLRYGSCKDQRHELKFVMISYIICFFLLKNTR